jgi:hypothetical protein
VLHEQRLLPDRVEVGEAAPDDHEVLRALADDLVRDADVAAPRIADVGRVHSSVLVSRPRPEADADDHEVGRLERRDADQQDQAARVDVVGSSSSGRSVRRTPPPA